MRLESEKNLKKTSDEEKKCILFAEKVETPERYGSSAPNIRIFKPHRPYVNVSSI